eukprot:scaffold14357_cov101-Isochrysis_galbana.AAC.5
MSSRHARASFPPGAGVSSTGAQQPLRSMAGCVVSPCQRAEFFLSLERLNGVGWIRVSHHRASLPTHRRFTHAFLTPPDAPCSHLPRVHTCAGADAARRRPRGLAARVHRGRV